MKSTYIVLKGFHYSLPNFNKLYPFIHRDEGEIMIPSKNWYPEEKITHSGWNKMTGIAQIFGVHQNSGRLVYQANIEKPGYFKVAAYTYTDGGDWQAEEICEIKGDIWYPYHVFWKDSKWHIMINCIEKNIVGSDPGCLSVKCHFYFGGQDKAYAMYKLYKR